MDFFRGMPVAVQMELDLSIKLQRLDVVVVRKEAGPLPCLLPDGFGELAPHNLITFKSYQEALDAWSIQELVGHYVNYRKQNSRSFRELLPEGDLRLFAVAVRSPRDLRRQVEMEEQWPGVYDVGPYGRPVLVLMVHELPREEQNALLHLFAGRTDLVAYGNAHYRPRSGETSMLLMQLFQRYRLEAPLMPDVLEQFVQESIDEMLKTLPPERILKGLSPEKRLEGLSPAKRLEGLSAEERLEGLSLKTRLEGQSPDEVLAALSPEMRAALARLFEGQRNPEAGGG